MRLALSSRTVVRKILRLLLVSCSLLCLGFGPPVLTDGAVPALRLFPHQVESLSALPEVPLLSAEAALLADVRTGTVIYQRRAQDALPPASTTKIMTALLALEQGALDEVVQVPAEALSVGEASMGLVPGEELTLEDLLYGLLLVSGNDAALTLAIHVGGSVDQFVGMMNERAEELGMTQTQFANPHGLDAPGHVSSAADLLALTREALESAVFARIVSTSEATVAGRYLVNTNELLGTYPGSDGVKTGTTDEAGECLVGSVSGDSGRSMVVLLGSEDRYADAEGLFDYFSHYYWERELSLPLDRMRDFKDGDGRLWSLMVDQRVPTLLPRWKWPLVQVFRIIDPSASIQSGQRIGAARFTLGSTVLAEVPLIASARE